MEKLSEQLVFEGNKINLVFKSVITGKMRTEIIKILENKKTKALIEMQRELAPSLMTKFEDGTNPEEFDNQLRMEAIKELNKQGFDITLLLQDSSEKENEDLLIQWYSIFQLGIDIEKTVSNISDEEKRLRLKEVLEKEIKSNLDFWNDQNLDLIEEKQKFFRSKFHIN
jgi:hypothetical protein